MVRGQHLYVNVIRRGPVLLPDHCALLDYLTNTIMHLIKRIFIHFNNYL